MSSSRLTLILCVALVAFPALSRAQAEQVAPLAHGVPREFTEFRGTWILDEAAGTGHISGLPVARTLIIATTPTEISLVKDAKDQEVYRIDGTETALKDSGTGAVLDRRYSFTLVAEMLALTSRRTRGTFTNIITDAYKVAGDVLTVERQLSVLSQPPGSLVTLSDQGNNRQTLFYRRNR